MKSFCILLLVFLSLRSHAQTLAERAQVFINSLANAQRSQAVFPMTSDERVNWNFVPTARKGISLHDLTSTQKNAAYDLLKASLSKSGFQKASDITLLEGILRLVEGRKPDDRYRDPLNYYFSIFGTPSEKSPWGWRFEGHHLSLNFSFIDGVIGSATPSFFGSNPANVMSGDQRGMRVLQREVDLAFLLLNSLTPAQLKTARFSESALPEILSFNNRNASPLLPVGISYAELNHEQQKLLMDLLMVYVDNYELGFSKKLKQKIESAGIDKLSFAWAGSLTPDDGHYYRIQGPMLLIEYDNTQNNANHIHTVVRDLTNDFADELLKEHYQLHHKN